VVEGAPLKRQFPQSSVASSHFGLSIPSPIPPKPPDCFSPAAPGLGVGKASVASGKEEVARANTPHHRICCPPSTPALRFPSLVQCEKVLLLKVKGNTQGRPSGESRRERRIRRWVEWEEP